MKKTYRYLTAVSFAAFLSGCQILPGQSIITPSPSATIPSNQLNTHDFWVIEGQKVIGTMAAIETRKGDTLPDIARHFGLGYNDIMAANPGIDPWLVEEGTKILLPTQFILPMTAQKGAVLNLAAMRLFYFPPRSTQQVLTYPVGIGRDDWETPKGLMKIVSKRKNPSWNVPISIQREHARKGEKVIKYVPPGPDNPLGEYALNLSKSGYLIHGTNKPYGVGMQVSHGCIRLYPEDISRFFAEVNVGTQVLIVDQPYLLGFENGILYLEAHRPLENARMEQQKLSENLQELALQYQLNIDWHKVNTVINLASGVPTPILTGSADFAQIVASAPLVEHPGYFYGSPIADKLTARDWSINVAKFSSEKAAIKLVEMLNHQGPIIPSRAVETADDLYQVVAGPFTNKQQALQVANKIEREFQIKSQINPPQTSASNNGFYPPSLDEKNQLQSELEAEEKALSSKMQRNDGTWFFQDWFDN